MGFYLDNRYISDSYMKYILINNNKTPLEGGAIGIDADPSILLNKLGIEEDHFSINDIIKAFTDIMDADSIDKYSSILTFDKSHILAIFYLIKSKKITLSDLDDIIHSTVYKNRTDLLLSFLERESPDANKAIDIFAPLKKMASSMSMYKNNGESVFTDSDIDNIRNSIDSIQGVSGCRKLNYGSYRYNSYSNSNNLYRSCDNWFKKISNILPDDDFSKKLFCNNIGSIEELEKILEEKASNPLANILSGFGILKDLIEHFFEITILKNPYSRKAVDDYNSFYGFNLWWFNNSIYSNWMKSSIIIPIDPIINDTYANAAAKYAKIDFKNRLKLKNYTYDGFSQNIDADISKYILESHTNTFNTYAWLSDIINGSNLNEENTSNYRIGDTTIHNYYSELKHFIDSSSQNPGLSIPHSQNDAIASITSFRGLGNSDCPLQVTENQYFQGLNDIKKSLFGVIENAIKPKEGIILDNNFFSNLFIRHTNLNDMFIYNKRILNKTTDELKDTIEEIPVIFNDNFIRLSYSYLYTGKSWQSPLIDKKTFRAILLMNMLIDDPKEDNGRIYADIINFGTMPIYKMINKISNGIISIIQKEIGENRIINSDYIKGYGTILIDRAIAILENEELKNTETEPIDMISYHYASIIVGKYLKYLKDDSNTMELYDSFRLILSNGVLGKDPTDEDLMAAEKAEFEKWMYDYYKTIYFLRHSILRLKEISMALVENTEYSLLIDANSSGINTQLDKIIEYLNIIAEKYCDSNPSNILNDFTVIMAILVCAIATITGLIDTEEYKKRSWPRVDAIEAMKEKLLIFYSSNR